VRTPGLWNPGPDARILLARHEAAHAVAIIDIVEMGESHKHRRGCTMDQDAALAIDDSIINVNVVCK
jgi:hypothetical protein